MKNKCLKIYFSDVRETFIVNIIMMIIISLILFVLSFPFYFYFVNLFIMIFFLIYFKNEIKMYFLVLSDLKNKKITKKDVVFDKIETDLKYGKSKRRGFFKKYTTPRYAFYYEKELYRIGFDIDALLYNEIRWKEFSVEFLENSKVIISIKPLYSVKETEKEKYIRCLGNCIFDEVVYEK